MRLRNKTAVITGGGTGIGLACAKLFRREGANVVISGRRLNRLQEAMQALDKNALAVQADVSKADDAGTLVQQAVDAFGGIDILVNNAGIFKGAPVHETSVEMWDEVFDINIRGVFLLTRQVLPQMLRQHTGGSIVHVSSILGVIAMPDTAAYNASKGALIQFSRSVAVEYGKHGIRSNTVCPALIATEMTAELIKDKDFVREELKSYPAGRLGAPDDIANACLYLASDESSFVTGAVLPVDGGYTAL